MCYIHRKPELFYPRKFVKVKSSYNQTVQTQGITSVYHGTHLDEMRQICHRPGVATFTGRCKQWRLPPEHDLDYCSYRIGSNGVLMTMSPGDNKTFGPFVWFGVDRNGAENYGPCQFEFDFKGVLKAYQESRGRSNTLCYRAGGTLVYIREVCHIVIICCNEDTEFETYPLIDAANTTYFKPPIIVVAPPSGTTSMSPPTKKSKLCNPYQDCTSHCGTLVFHQIPPDGLSYPALISTTEYVGLESDEDSEDSEDDCSSEEADPPRREVVVLAVYLPPHTTLELNNRVGIVYEGPHNFCVKSRSDRCQYNRERHNIPHFIDKFSQA